MGHLVTQEGSELDEWGGWVRTDCRKEFSQQGQSMNNAVTWILGLGLMLFMSLTCFEAYSRPKPTLYQPKQDQVVIEGRGEYFDDEAGKLRFRLFKWEE